MLVTSYNTTHYTMPQQRRLLKNAGNIIKYYIPHHATAQDHALNFYHCDNYKSQTYLLSYLWSQLGRLIFLNNGCNITDIHATSSLGITKHHLMKGYESGSMAQTILNVSTRWRQVISSCSGHFILR